MSDPLTITMPIPPPSEPRKRRWLVPAVVGIGAFSLGLVVGAAFFGAGQTSGAPQADELQASAPPPPRPTGTCTDGMTIPEGSGQSLSDESGGEYYVHNNNWNDTAGGNSVITACDYDNWNAGLGHPGPLRPVGTDLFERAPGLRR